MGRSCLDLTLTSQNLNSIKKGHAKRAEFGRNRSAKEASLQRKHFNPNLFLPPLPIPAYFSTLFSLRVTVTPAGDQTVSTQLQAGWQFLAAFLSSLAEPPPAASDQVTSNAGRSCILQRAKSQGLSPLTEICSLGLVTSGWYIYGAALSEAVHSHLESRLSDSEHWPSRLPALFASLPLFFFWPSHSHNLRLVLVGFICIPIISTLLSYNCKSLLQS